jgi:GNAT superfamily N-acetyltransferase
LIRLGAGGDLSALIALRDSRNENRLSDPTRLTETEALRLIAEGAVWVWDEGGAVLGLVAADRRDGSIPALLVAPGHDGKGIGRALLAVACDFLGAWSHTLVRLELDPGSAAERHYRNSRWTVVGRGENGGWVFEKPL